MPWTPRPFTFLCSKCGWKKTVAPLSDALGPDEYFSQCPKCGGEKVEVRKAGWLEGAIAKLMARERRFRA